MSDRGDPLLDSIFSRTTNGIKLGLDRILLATEQLCNPQYVFRSIHIAGTNGKGSVATFLESVLRMAGYRTGLYTSPHIINFEERFRINGKSVSDTQWRLVYADIMTICDNLGCTFFEIATLIAFELFKRENVEFAIFETGLGGRLDATNILCPEVSVITTIALDHAEYLGDTISLVTGEKAGIIKKNVPCVAVFDPKTSPILIKQANQYHAPLYFIEPSIDVTEINTDTFKFENCLYQCGLPGKCQHINAALAIKATSLINIDSKKVVSGIVNAKISGRFDLQIVNGRKILFDVAHNPDATTALCYHLSTQYAKSNILIVVGIMADKDCLDMMLCYAKIASEIITVTPKTIRAMPSKKLATMIDFANIKECCSVNAGIDLAFSTDAELIVVTGSFYTVGEAMKHLDLNPV